MMQHRCKVAVLYGGRSGEHEVSLRSAASILQHLDDDKYEVLPVSIDKGGVWRLQNVAALRVAARKGGAAAGLPVRDEAPEVWLAPGRPMLVDAAGGLHEIDAVFPVVHGPLCEDGSLQGLLELSDVAYVGSGVLASAMAMDKEVAKRLVTSAGVPTAAFVSLRAAEWLRDPRAAIEKVFEVLSLPVFVKPVNLGSSVGISRVTELDQLHAAIDAAFAYDHKVLVEQALEVREIELSVLQAVDPDAAPEVSVAGEIVPHHAFYSYEAKYLDDAGAALIVPATLEDEQLQEAQALARKVFVLLECEGMARVDLFLERQTRRWFFNEINTIPGFTRISMFPALWAASGLAYGALLERLIELARRRHVQRRSLRRDWTADAAP